MKKVIVLATVAVLATACEFNLFDKIKIGKHGSGYAEKRDGEDGKDVFHDPVLSARRF